MQTKPRALRTFNTFRGSVGFNVNDLKPYKGSQFFSWWYSFHIKIQRNCFTYSFKEIIETLSSSMTSRERWYGCNKPPAFILFYNNIELHSPSFIWLFLYSIHFLFAIFPVYVRYKLPGRHRRPDDFHDREGSEAISRHGESICRLIAGYFRYE